LPFFFFFFFFFFLRSVGTAGGTPTAGPDGSALSAIAPSSSSPSASGAPWWLLRGDFDERGEVVSERGDVPCTTNSCS
jgi:hypothetical protein